MMNAKSKISLLVAMGMLASTSAWSKAAVMEADDSADAISSIVKVMPEVEKDVVEKATMAEKAKKAAANVGGKVVDGVMKGEAKEDENLEQTATRVAADIGKEIGAEVADSFMKPIVVAVIDYFIGPDEDATDEVKKASQKAIDAQADTVVAGIKSIGSKVIDSEVFQDLVKTPVKAAWSWVKSWF